MKDKPTEYVLCLNNSQYSASLEARKLYLTIPDAEAESRHLIRIIDESGEDYLYPTENFVYVVLALSTNYRSIVA